MLFLSVFKKLPYSNIDFHKKEPEPSTSFEPHRIFNVGNSQPTPLMEYIAAIEDTLKLKAKFNFLPMQKGDIKETYADNSALESWIDYKPTTSIKDGVNQFVKWYIDFYKT